jgi:hypothetical protein
MNIYFNGDSFTSGVELNDHLIPGFLKIRSGDDWEKTFEKWMSTKQKYLNKLEFHEREKFDSDHYALAWPQKLCSILNAQCINKSVSGSSTLGILHRTNIDLLNMKKDGITLDAVIIQITSRHRTGIYNTDDLVSEDNRSIITELTNFEKGKTKPQNKKYFDAWLKAEDDEAILHRWFHQYHLIKAIVKSIYGLDVIFVDSCFLDRLTVNAINDNKNMHTRTLIDDSKFLDPKLIDMVSLNFEKQNGILPGGHFAEVVHKRFAKHLAKQYF